RGPERAEVPRAMRWPRPAVGLPGVGRGSPRRATVHRRPRRDRGRRRAAPPSRGSSVAALPVSIRATTDGPCGVAIAAGSVWVDGYASASVIRVDPQTLKIVKRIPMGDQIWDITVGAGSVWATGTSSNFIARINPKT